MRLVGWTAWACLTFALTACGRTQSAPSAASTNGAGGSPETSSSPERLVAWQLEAEGTEPLDVGVFDTELQKHCRFVPDSDGQLRCLPLTPGGLDVTSRFADPDCQEAVYRSLLPAARAWLMAAARPTTVPLPLDGCEQRYAVGTLTEVDTSAPQYFRFGTSCTRTGALNGVASNLQDSVRDFKLAEVIPPTRYVTGSEVGGDIVGGRLRLRQLETPGGFRIVRSLLDER